jgi:hypothetical protein
MQACADALGAVFGTGPFVFLKSKHRRDLYVCDTDNDMSPAQIRRSGVVAVREALKGNFETVGGKTARHVFELQRWSNAIFRRHFSAYLSY